MVAYSFKKQFAPHILDDSKIGTIRADRKRHARPREELQLYTGMRTRQCRLVARKSCRAVLSIRIDVRPTEIRGIEVDGVALPESGLNAFARGDGFASIEDMHSFWIREHGAGEFTGVWIVWGSRKCPHPASDEPKGQTAQECFDHDNCGCDEFWFSALRLGCGA